MTFTLINEAKKKAETIPPLEHVLCIYYLFFFKKDCAEIQALIYSSSKVNAIAPAYAAKLGLKIWLIDVKTKRIHGSILETFGMVPASFQAKDKLGQLRFFQKTFLIADTNVAGILNMLFWLSIMQIFYI